MAELFEIIFWRSNVEYRPKQLVIVRHGETEWNEVAKAVRTRQIPLPDHLKGVPNHRTKLSQKGIAQATATGEKLAGIHGSFDAVYHSLYRRAVETTDLILGQFPDAAKAGMAKARFPHFLLVEQNPGELDPALHDDLDAEHALYQKYRALAVAHGHFYLQYAGVESWAQVALRVRLFLQMLHQKPGCEGQKLLIVTHGITMLLFRYLLEGLSEEKLEDVHENEHPHNCGVYTYVWDDAGKHYKVTGSNEIFY